jgi:hypothetical protein
MATPPETGQDSERPTRRRWYIAAGVLGLLLLVVGVSSYSAVQASNTKAEDLLLSDGVDRSRLPRTQALALATLARDRQESLPDDTGHDHGHEMSTAEEMTPDQHDELVAQLAVAAEIVPRYNTLEEIEAAGYVQGSGFADGSGAHFVNWSMVDRPFDPETPSQLLLEVLEWGKDPELIALSYWLTSDTRPEGFAGHEDQWHRHRGMCFENAWLRNENLPDPDGCSGDWINGEDIWMLHVWVVPGLENSLGRFAAVNPLLCERTCGLEN